MTNKEALELIPYVRQVYGSRNFTRDSYTASEWFKLVEKALKREASWEEDNAYREKLFGQLLDYKESEQ